MLLQWSQTLNTYYKYSEVFYILDCYKGDDIKVEFNISVGIEYQNILCNL